MDQRTSPEERRQVAAALAGRGRWVVIRFGWRPNLPDEKDNHLIELAIAGNASAIVTHNVKELTRGELVWGQLRVMTPGQMLEHLRARTEKVE